MLERLSEALRHALADEGLRRRFAELATEPASDAQACPAFRDFLAAGIARWRPIIQAAGAYTD